MTKKQPTIVSEVEIVMVNKPITDNISEPLETINLTSFQEQGITKQEFEEALRKATRPVKKQGK